MKKPSKKLTAKLFTMADVEGTNLSLAYEVDVVDGMVTNVKQISRAEDSTPMAAHQIYRDIWKCHKTQTVKGIFR